MSTRPALPMMAARETCSVFAQLAHQAGEKPSPSIARYRGKAGSLLQGGPVPPNCFTLPRRTWQIQWPRLASRHSGSHCAPRLLPNFFTVASLRC